MQHMEPEGKCMPNFQCSFIVFGLQSVTQIQCSIFHSWCCVGTHEISDFVFLYHEWSNFRYFLLYIIMYLYISLSLGGGELGFLTLKGVKHGLIDCPKSKSWWWPSTSFGLLIGSLGDGSYEWPSSSFSTQAPFTIPKPGGAGVADPAALLESLEGSEGGVWRHCPVLWWGGWVSLGISGSLGFWSQW